MMLRAAPSSCCCSSSSSCSASTPLHGSSFLSLTKHQKSWLPVAFPTLSRSTSRKLKRSIRARALQEGDHHHSQHSQDQDQAAPAAAVAEEGASEVHVDIAPSVLHALQAGAQSPSAGRSLIERNLRKRAASSRKGVVKPSLDDGVSQDHIDAAKDEMNIRQASTDEMNTRHGFSSADANVQDIGCENASVNSRDPEVSVMDPASSRVDSTSISGIGFYQGSFTHLDALPSKKGTDSSQSGGCSANPLTSIFWEEKPPDLSLASFLTLDSHLVHYRRTLCDWIHDPSFLSMVWLYMPQSFHSLQRSELPLGISKVLRDFKGTVTKDLSDLMSDKRPFIQAGLECVDSWEGTSSLSTLITVLALSVEVDLLSELEGEEGERLKSVVGSLRKALYWLNGDVLDPVNLWEKAIKGSAFASDGCVYVYEHALIFSGNLTSSSGSKSCGGQELLEKVQQCLDKDERFSGRMALCLKSTEKRDQVYLVIAPWYWVLSPRHDQYQGLKWLLLVASAFATTFYPAAAPELHVTGVLWEPCAVTLGCMAILASVIFANRCKLPLFIPFFSVGAVGKSTPFPRVLPSRTSFLEVLLDTSCAALILSLLLLAVGFTFWGPAHYNSLDVLDLSGYVLARADLFHYSDVFTRVLNRLSVATTTGENGEVLLATHPFALAGLLGLNYVAFSVLPLYGTDGARLFKNLLGNTKLEKNIAVGVPVLASILLCLVHPVLGLAWAFGALFDTGSFPKDEVSEPSFAMKVLGFAVIATGIACFFPLPS